MPGRQRTRRLAGSLAPIIAVRLLETADSERPIASYLAAIAAVSAVAALVAEETRGVDLAAVDGTDAEGPGLHPGSRSRPPHPPELVEGRL